MESKYSQILEILRIFEASDLLALTVEMDGVRLSASKEGVASALAVGELSPSAAPRRQHMIDESTAAPEVIRSGVAKPNRVDGGTPAAEKAAGDYESSAHVVRAPMLGTFYRSKAPGEPPFVSEGTRIDATDTLCLIECMKLFNTIQAGVNGRLLRFAVENGDLVEFDQPIAYIAEE